MGAAEKTPQRNTQRLEKKSNVLFWRDQDFPGLEIRSSSYEVVAFPKHTHEAYSIGFVESGRSKVFLRGRSGVVNVGEIVLIHPNEVHACNPRDDSGWAYRMFYVRPELLQETAAALNIPLCQEPGFDRAAVQDPPLLSMLRKFHQSIVDKHFAGEKEALLLECFARLFRKHAGLKPPEADFSLSSQSMRQVKDWLHEHAAEKISLEQLAELTGMSRYSVLRGFKKATRLTPHEYQNQLRIAHAKDLLAAQTPIADVALELGFSDQSHFSNTFRRITGATPRQYKAAL